MMPRLIIIRLIWLILLLTCTAGCLPSAKTVKTASLKEFGRDPMQQARLNCFLVLENADAPGMRLELSSVEVLAEGVWIPVTGSTMTLDSAALGEKQLLLGWQNVPPGEYRRLRMTINRSEAQNNSGEYVELSSVPQKLELRLTAPLTVNLDDSKTLIFTWDVEKSLEYRDRFLPSIVVSPPSKELLRDLVFVSCPTIDTIFVVRADTNWVVNSFGVKGGPTYLMVDSSSSNPLLYVLTSRDRMVKVIDLETYRGVEFFAVPLNDDPTFMTMKPDGNEIYLLDEMRSRLTRVATETGEILASVMLDYQPSFALYLPEQEQLAVSLALSQEVALLDPLTLQTTRSYSTGSSPQGLLVDGSLLYIAERGDNSVAIIDLVSSGQQSRFAVGLGPRRLLAADNQIFVANVRDGSISALGSSDFGVVQEIFDLGTPGEMVLDNFYRRLYVADQEKDELTVIDVNANRIIERIKIGAVPFGMVVIQ